jgi:alkanesulfonate monooxygenase SsuD/methylene tetrahydromethanopterin reductase-like flavin-dependent oxidoreductase (luciferase family)
MALSSGEDPNMSEAVKFGFVPAAFENPETGVKPSWETIRSQAVAAEEAGFDIVWAPDELLWRVPDWHGETGWWECVALTGALAAATSTIQVGTWVLSALHRSPGLSVKVAHTLDEISGGRFVLGLGSGHAGDQGKTFGYPMDKTVGRYEEALEILVPALKGHPRWSLPLGE